MISAKAGNASSAREGVRCVQTLSFALKAVTEVPVARTVPAPSELEIMFGVMGPDPP